MLFSVSEFGHYNIVSMSSLFVFVVLPVLLALMESLPPLSGKLSSPDPAEMISLQK